MSTRKKIDMRSLSRRPAMPTYFVHWVAGPRGTPHPDTDVDWIMAHSPYRVLPGLIRVLVDQRLPSGTFTVTVFPESMQWFDHDMLEPPRHFHVSWKGGTVEVEEEVFESVAEWEDYCAGWHRAREQAERIPQQRYAGAEVAS